MRIKHDDVVGIGQFVVTGRGIEKIADHRCALPAAVKRHMHFARLRLAGFWHVGIRSVAHAGDERADEFTLVELDELAGQCAHRRIQIAVDVVQDVV